MDMVNFTINAFRGHRWRRRESKSYRRYSDQGWFKLSLKGVGWRSEKGEWMVMCRMDLGGGG